MLGYPVKGMGCSRGCWGVYRGVEGMYRAMWGAGVPGERDGVQ